MKSAVVSTILALATGAELRTASNGKAIFGQYVVRLGDHETMDGLDDHLANMRNVLGSDMETLFVYKNLGNFVGYSAKLSYKGLEAVLKDERVSFVEEDQVISLDQCKSEANPDWGLARINERNYTATGTYNYDYSVGKTGAGVDAYIIDTGIYCENNDFTQKVTGTCTFGYSSVKSITGALFSF